MEEKKFKAGDRVKALLSDGWISAEVLRYEDYSIYKSRSVWCRWDDDGEDATMPEDKLEFDVLYYSPLMKALR